MVHYTKLLTHQVSLQVETLEDTQNYSYFPENREWKFFICDYLTIFFIEQFSQNIFSFVDDRAANQMTILLWLLEPYLSIIIFK